MLTTCQSLAFYLSMFAVELHMGVSPKEFFVSSD